MTQRMLALFLVLAVLGVADARADGRAGIAATVNDEVITMADVESRTRLYLSGGQGQPPPELVKRVREQVLEKLIDEKLQMSEAKSLGIGVEQAQIDSGFADIARQNKFTPEEFRKRLGAAGVRVSSLEDQIRAEVAWSQVVRRKLRSQVSISETEIDGAIEQLARNRTRPQYRVAEIFLAVGSAAQDAEVQRDAEKLAQQITKGARFSEVAREFSQAPGAATGGDLGWVQEGQLDAKLDAALRALEPGQLSPPVKTEKGYHILFLREKQLPRASAEAAVTPVPAPAAPAVLRLMQIGIDVDAKDPPAILAAKTARLDSLKAEISSCAQMAEKSRDFSSAATGDLGARAPESLSPAVRAAVESLKEGQLSPPVRIEGAVVALMVCGRAGGVAPAVAAAAPATPVAPAVPDRNDQGAREKIANSLGMQRLEQLQDRYLKDLRATAFIEKRI